ncbi:pilus assembly protein PilP [Desulfobacterales bacterium HSG16]|nr:pilus assembly protein PilP [Desulfobacterales bacterium HSG16]
MNRFCFLIIIIYCILCLLIVGCDDSSNSPEEDGVIKKKISLTSRDKDSEDKISGQGVNEDKESDASDKTMPDETVLAETESSHPDRPVDPQPVESRPVKSQPIESQPIESSKAGDVESSVIPETSVSEKKPLAEVDAEPEEKLDSVASPAENESVDRESNIAESAEAVLEQPALISSASDEVNTDGDAESSIEEEGFQPPPIPDSESILAEKETAVGDNEVSGTKPVDSIMGSKGDSGGNIGVGSRGKAWGEKRLVASLRYDPKNRVDPFEPLFKEEEPADSRAELEAKAKLAAEEKKRGRKKPAKAKRIPRTPLEKVDLSQLKLVGIVRAGAGNRALVEETSGKGYIITKGTYIGINAGKVSEILKDKVIVLEEDSDFSGNVTFRERVMKLQKPPGEGYHEM